MIVPIKIPNIFSVERPARFNCFKLINLLSALVYWYICKCTACSCSSEILPMIVDSFNRIHNYLRISLTDNCNLRCFYCMPEEDYQSTPVARLMQLPEIVSLATTFVKMGVTKIRLTGGEPLIRKDAAEIIKALANLPVELTLTTNATRLHLFKAVLKESNINSINVSLDTLDPDRFEMITRRRQFKLVLENINWLLQHNLHVKINVVLMKGINDKEINDFIRWTKDTPVHIRFIEFMPFDGNHWNNDKLVSMQEILGTVSQEFNWQKLPDAAHDTSKKFNVPGHVGTFAIISTITSNFCSSCNRLRLTADGKMKNCLFSREETDLLTALRNGQDVAPLIESCIKSKAKELGGQFSNDFNNIQPGEIFNRSMISIGG